VPLGFAQVGKRYADAAISPAIKAPASLKLLKEVRLGLKQERRQLVRHSTSVLI